jgi:hypothetical protein
MLKNALTTILFLSVCFNTLCQDTKQCLKIDFESIGTTNLYEGLPINNQFFNEFGVTFELEDGRPPLLAKVGGTTPFAFHSNWGSDTPKPEANVGNYFITDDGLVTVLKATPLIVRFENPVDSVSAEVMDMDFDEVFTVTARDKNDNVLLTKTIKSGDPNTGDGAATLFGFNMAGCLGTIYSLKFEGTRQVSGGFGFAMDNFSFCFSGIDLENSIRYAVEDPTCVNPKGTITLLSNGTYEVLYSLDKINYSTLGDIKDLGPGTYQIHVKSADEGCDAELEIEIPDLTYPEIENVPTVQTTCGRSNGIISIDADDPNVLYSINASPFTNNRIFDNLSPGDYTIVIKNDLECRDSLNVSISPSVDVEIAAITSTKDLCKSGNGSLALDMATMGNYRYYLDNVEILESEKSNLKAGLYKITVRDDKGCVLDTFVNILPTPEISIASIISHPTKCNEMTGQLKLVVTAGDSQLEYFLNGKRIDEPSDIKNLDWGQYEIVVRDEYGCELRNIADVERDKCAIFLPNIINANSTTGNNKLILNSISDYDFGIVRYRIYDRWGNLIYDAKNFGRNEDIYLWDGTFNGSPAEVGVYAYIIDVVHPNGESDVLKGDVTVIR